jgi:hypothetical protein
MLSSFPLLWPNRLSQSESVKAYSVNQRPLSNDKNIKSTFKTRSNVIRKSNSTRNPRTSSKRRLRRAVALNRNYQTKSMNPSSAICMRSSLRRLSSQ